MTPVVELVRVSKTYSRGETAVRALRGVSLTIERGDYVAIMGTSGSGKSTMMNVIGCLDVADHGRYRLDGTDVAELTETQLAAVRNRNIGFVFQSFNLLARTTALRNVELPMIYARVPAAERRRRALSALRAVGLGDRVDHLPNQLSGGQQQRVAVARSIVNKPAMILADEPTGALDSRSTTDLLDVFAALNRAGRTIVVITHEAGVAACAKRVVWLRDGQILDDSRTTPIDQPPPAPREVADTVGAFR